MAGNTLVFHGRRWPAAVAREHEPISFFSDGTLLSGRRFVEIATTGQGQRWTPEPAGAVWRDLAALDLADPDACKKFARRRGDPSGVLSPTSAIVTVNWYALATALQRAAAAWSAPADDGVSSVILEYAEREALAKQTWEQISLAPTVWLGDGFAWALNTDDRFDNFLIISAVEALKRALPMRRCTVCNSWFEIRRPQRQPQFCSQTCRAVHHQQQRGG